MNTDFVITGIRRIILVDKKEYPERVSTFTGKLRSNELIFHFSGRSVSHFGDQVLTVTPGTVRFLPQETVSRYDVVREEAGECIDVFFSTDRPVSADAFVLDASGNERVGQLFRRLFACWASKEEGYYFSCISMLYLLFAELQKTSRAPGVHFEKIKPAMDYLHGHFPEADITVPTLAAMCGIKAAYFNRLFRSLLLQPPIQGAHRHSTHPIRQKMPLL